MKRSFVKWIFRITTAIMFIGFLLLLIILNPLLSYANSAIYKNYRILHNKPVDKNLLECLNNAISLIKHSEFYDAAMKPDICLNDGSEYPALIEKLQGKAFARGFYKNVVLNGSADFKNNTVELNGYKWNLTQLLAHEITHCLQFNKLGLWHSNPLARIPDWKWEGYPEYIARQNKDQKDIVRNMDCLQQIKQRSDNGWIQFNDSSGTVILYYEYWLLVKYCMDIKKMTYAQLLEDTTTEKDMKHQLAEWYTHIKKDN